METIKEIKDKADKEKIAFFDWAMNQKGFSVWVNKYTQSK